METPTFQDVLAVAPEWADACETLTSQIGQHQSLASRPLHSHNHPYALFLSRLLAGRMASSPSELMELAERDVAELLALADQVRLIADVKGMHFTSETLGLLTNFGPVITDSLTHAAPIFVTHELHEMAEQAAHTLPDDINITPQLMFEPDLWLYFQDGITIHAQPHTFVIKAVLLHSEAHLRDDAHGIHFIAYSDYDGILLPVDAGLLPFGTDHWWARLDDPADDWHAAVLDAMPEMDRKASEAMASSIAECERFIVAALMLMGQKDFVSVEGHHRKVLRRLAHAQKTNHPVRPRIVLLRRRELATGRSGGTGVRRERRWWRRGHWRQYQPNRYTWVTGHVCGPADAEDPLIRNSYIAK